MSSEEVRADLSQSKDAIPSGPLRASSHPLETRSLPQLFKPHFSPPCVALNLHVV